MGDVCEQLLAAEKEVMEAYAILRRLRRLEVISREDADDMRRHLYTIHARLEMAQEKVGGEGE